MVRHLLLWIWFWIGMVIELVIFVVPGLTITLIAILKRGLGWVIGRDPDLWAPFPNAPRFWNWVVYNTARFFMNVRMSVHVTEGAQRVLRSAPIGVILSNHPTEIEFPFSFRVVFETVRTQRILSTQASWNRWLIMGPLFDMAGGHIALRRKKDGYKNGEGQRDFVEGLRRLWKFATLVHVYPDSNRPSPQRVAVANARYGTDFTYIISPRSGGMKAILDHIDRGGLGNVPVILMSAGFGFRYRLKQFWKWFNLFGKTYFAKVDVVSSDTLPRDEEELRIWLRDWARDCDAHLKDAAKANGFV